MPDTSITTAAQRWWPVGLAVAVILGVCAVALLANPEQPRPVSPMPDATLTPRKDVRDGIAAMIRMNGKACDEVLSVTSINADDLNVECAKPGGHRTMYLVNMRA